MRRMLKLQGISDLGIKRIFSKRNHDSASSAPRGIPYAASRLSRKAKRCSAGERNDEAQRERLSERRGRGRGLDERREEDVAECGDVSLRREWTSLTTVTEP